MLPNSSSRSESTPAQGFVAKGCGTLFFGIFAVAGILFTGVMILSFAQTLQPYFWGATPCTIVESQRAVAGLEKTSKSGEPLVIRYRYEVGGRVYQSDRLSRGMRQSLDSREIERLLARFQQGTSAMCYVNSKNPEESVLFRGPLWPVLFILMPLVFVGVGVVGSIGVWRGEEWSRRAAARRRSSKTMGTAGKLFFFGLFLLIGGILTYVVAILPLQKFFASKHWPAIPCQILSSQVGSHRGSKGGTTYSVDVTYRYQVNGRDFQSDTYSILTGSSGGRSSKERIVARYPAGSQAVCYVNPEDPTDTLLSRELSPFLLIGLIPGLFFLVGLVGVGSTIRSSLNAVRNRSSVPVLPGSSTVLPTVPLPITPSMVGPAELKPEFSPLTKFGVAILLALFWNGITGIFAWFAVSSFIEGKPEWFLTIFITPFILIGLLMIGFVGSAFLNLFNPRIRLSVNSAAILPGDRLEVNWLFNGSSDRIKHFTLTLEGREEVSQGSGKNRRTNRDVFFSHSFVDTSDPQQIAQGRASVEIPAGQKPTDKEGNRKVIWTLKAVGEIPRYPDFGEEYEVTVLAREVRQNDEDFID